MQLDLTLVIVIVTVLVSFIAFNNQEVFSKFLFNPYQVLRRGEWYRVLTHAFIHGNFLHLLFNMYVLYNFGQIIEEIFTTAPVFKLLFPQLDFWGVSRGYLYYVLLYFGGILFAVIPGMAKHGNNPGYNSLGASGAVSAVVMAFIILMPTMSLRFIFIPVDIPAFVIGIFYLGYEYYMNKRGGTGIAHDAHLWGAAYGVVLTCVINYHFALLFFHKVSSFLEGLFS